MVLIPAKGESFQMGNADGEASEKPVHTVSFTYDFYMDTTEVTQGDYASLMSQTFPNYSDPHWTEYFKTGDNNPVYNVGWFDAILYCNARSKRDGFDTVYTYTDIVGTPGKECGLNGVESDPHKTGYRLPTEAEWEFACRAGTTTDYYWGDQANGLYANGGDHNYGAWPEDGLHGAAEVASLIPNDFGLYDMSGNVWEWCHTICVSPYPSADPVTDPFGPDSGTQRSQRGGSWDHGAKWLRSSSRYCDNPSTTRPVIGFRVVIPKY
jgi:formylglycine-generating enzyme required for sulfatase activity